MKAKLITVALSLAMAAPVYAQTWSEVDVTDSGIPYISAMAKNDSSTFMGLYAYPERSCQVGVAVFGTSDTPSSYEGDYDVRLSFRVDRNAVIRVDTKMTLGNYKSDAGQVTGFVRAVVMTSDDFLAQFVTGESVIFKINDASDDEQLVETTRWSLNGSRQAFNELVGACTGIANESDEWSEQQPAKWQRQNYEGDEWES